MAVDLSLLITKDKDKDFHRSRIMFCIKDGVIKVASKGVIDCHLDWFEKEGWINKRNIQQFFNTNIRGFYLPAQNSLYCYKGIGFWFDDDLIEKVLAKLPQLRDKLDLNDDTMICFGPKDSTIAGIKYQREQRGTVKDLLHFDK